jgi:glycosyltransferase involved in cell wall biosynthesis
MTGMLEEVPAGGRRLCTILAKNYLVSAALLAESFRLHHPDVPVTALVVDGRPGDALGGLPFEVVFPSDLPLDADEFGRMATYYDVTELSTALKPFLLQALLDRGNDVVMYLDPDIEVFAPLNDLFDLAAERAIALTPHVTRPIPRDGLDVREEVILSSGQFNLGFIAVSSAASSFLEYWRDRTRLHSLIDQARGYFTDQRWLDAVPVLFEHAVVRDTCCNVAYWNLHERTLSDVDPSPNDSSPDDSSPDDSSPDDSGSAHRDGRWMVDGRPLRFFHFSGHDAREPYRLSRHVVRPRVRVDLHPPLRRLLRSRADRIIARREPGCDAPYGWNRTQDGILLDADVRRLYWEAVWDAERDGLPFPPAAFGRDGGRAFTSWLQAPIAPGSAVPRYFFARWRARVDLQRAFPEPFGEDADRLLAWGAADAEFERSTPLPLRVMPDRVRSTPGVNLVGYLAGEFGVAAASRSLARMMRATGLPVATTTVRVANHRHGVRPTTTIEGEPFDLSVLAVNADELVRLWNTPEFAPHHTRARVGVWYWEVGVLPEPMRKAFDLVDEVWCVSDYVRDCLAPWGDRPVLKHPLVFDEAVPTALRRADLGLPEDPFLFGYVFDYSSVLQRKNPVGLIDAYRRAFGPDDGASLILKTIHAEVWPAAAARVREAAAERNDIVFLDGFLDPLEMRALFQLVDCYVSLHRSEGLGLTLASAMAAGTPAIATGWSGNLEFMSSDDSILCPYKLVEVGPDAAPYPASAWWADPDLDAAADAMRRLFERPDVAKHLGAKGRAKFANNFRAAAAGPWFVDRFNALAGRSIPA